MPIENTLVANDFRIFYQSAQTISNNPELLYSLPDYNMPFRYLPLFSLFFIPYTLIPYEIAFTIHTIILGVVQTASFYLVYIISTRFYKIKYDNKVKSDLLFICLMAPLQVPMILIGQISHFFILFILLVILLMENVRVKRYNIKYEQVFIGLLLGFSISLKPFAILLIPFLVKMVITIKNEKIKIHFNNGLKLIFGLFLSQISNFIYLILYPNILQDFLGINTSTQLFNYPSTSITRLISVIFDSFSIEAIVMIILIFPLYGLLYSIYLLTPNNKINYPVYFSGIILVIMIIYTDSWFLNFLIWFTVIFPGLFQFEDEITLHSSIKIQKKLKITNFIIYKISYYGILYFTLGVVIGLTIITTDPIMPFLLIILYIIIIWRLIRCR